jgi:hypothetical protein
MGTVVLVFVQSAEPDLALVEIAPLDRFTAVVGKKRFINGVLDKENTMFDRARMYRAVVRDLTSKAVHKRLGARLDC